MTESSRTAEATFQCWLFASGGRLPVSLQTIATPLETPSLKLWRCRSLVEIILQDVKDALNDSEVPRPSAIECKAQGKFSADLWPVTDVR